MASRIISAFRFALNADARTFNREMRRGQRLITDQERAMRSLQRTVRTTGQRFQSFQRNVISLRGALVGIAGVAGFARLAQQSTQAATALLELSQRSGFAAERLQTLERVFQGDGVSAEQFNRAIDRMNDVINDAERGLSTAEDALEQINLEFSDLQGLRPEEQFERIADGVANLATESERAGVVRDIFGARAAGFINVLQRGTDALREQEAAFAQLGVTSTEDLEALKALNQEFTNISTTLRVSLQQAFADSAGELSSLLQNLQRLIQQGTPVAINLVGTATDIATSAANNTGALTTAAGAFFGGRAIASGANLANTALQAFGRSTSLWATRLAAFAGPAGAIVSAISIMYAFRDQLADLGRAIGLVSGRATESPLPEGASSGELAGEINRLTVLLNTIPAILRNDRNIGYTARNLRDFIREAGVGEINAERLNEAINRVNPGDLRIPGNYNIYIRDLQRALSIGFSEIISELQGQLGRRLQQEEERRRPDIPPSEPVQIEDTTAEQERLISLAEQERAQRERVNAQLQQGRENILAIVDAEQDVVTFLREIGTQTERNTLAEERIRNLLIDQQDITARISRLRLLGFAEDADELADDLLRVNVQLEQLQQLSDLGVFVNVTAPETPIIQDATTLRDIVGNDGLTLINAVALAEARENVNLIFDQFLQLPTQAEELDASLRANAVRFRTLGEITQDWISTTRDGLAQIVVFTDSWREAWERLLRLGVTNLISALFTEDRLRSLFTGRQFGGPVNAGRPYLVGESGPELFVPRSAGEIVSNRETGGLGGVTVNFNPVINSTDGPGVRNALQQALPRLRQDIENTFKNNQNVTLARGRAA